MHALERTLDNATFDYMELLNTTINWWDFFSIYTFQTDPDKMTLTFSLRCGMLIVGSRTVCLFFIYFPTVPVTATCQMVVLGGKSSQFSLRAPRSWQISPHPKSSTSLVEGKAGVIFSQSWSIFFVLLSRGALWVTCPLNLHLPPFLLCHGERVPKVCSGPWAHFE